MTGLIVLAVALLLAVSFGIYRRLSDGRVVAVAPTDAVAATETAEYGFDLGERATLVQFSTAMCAPCRPTRELLEAIADDRTGVRHVEIDATERLDLVERFEVRRTPTVLILDGNGHLRHRVSGVPKADDLALALDDLCAVRA